MSGGHIVIFLFKVQLLRLLKN